MPHNSSSSRGPNRILLDWIPSPGGYDGFTLEIAGDPLFASGYAIYEGSEHRASNTRWFLERHPTSA